MIQTISSEPEALLSALQNKNQTVVCNRKGQWWIKGERWNGRMVFIEWIIDLFRPEHKRIHEIAQMVIGQLNQMEKNPVLFSVRDQESLPKEIVEQNKRLNTYLKISKWSKKKIKEENRKDDRNIRFSLSQGKTALRYRMEITKSGLTEQEKHDSSSLDDLIDLAKPWKKSVKNYKIKDLQPKELEKLEEVACYPKFVKMLKKNKRLQGSFFKWILRDNNSIQAFIEFPKTCQQLKGAHLSGIMGENIHLFRYIQKQKKGGSFLREKVFTLPFKLKSGKTEEISILDPKRIEEFERGKKESIEKVIEAFEKCNHETADFSWLGEQGIANWHLGELGPYDPEKGDYDRIPISCAMWWKRLPVLATLTDDEIKERFGCQEVKEDEWVIIAKASREFPDFNIINCHGSYLFLVPNNGKWELRSCGKLALKFPSMWFHFLWILAHTVLARIMSPDPDVGYSNRQHGFYPVVCDANEGEEFMNEFRLEIVKARKKYCIFQFLAENCAHSPQTTLEKVFGKEREGGRIPDLYTFPVQLCESSNPAVIKILQALNAVPKKWSLFLLRGVIQVLGGWRGVTVIENGKKVRKSVSNSFFYEKGEIYHASQLIDQLMKNKISGVVSFGSMHLKQN